MSNVLTLTASSMASYQTSWYHTGEIIQGYYNNNTNKIYFGYCWFSAADLATLRNTITSAVNVEKVELYFQRANTSHGVTSATAVQVNNTTRSGASGTPSTSELSNGKIIGSFTQGQAKWCEITKALLNPLLSNRNGFCFYHNSASASGQYSYYVRSTTLPKLRITYAPRWSYLATDKTKMEFNQQITSTITPNDATFKHVIKYQLGEQSQSYDLAAGTTETSFTVPNSWMNEIPNAALGQMIVTLTTYDANNNLIGSESVSVEVDVPESVIPSAGTIGIAIGDDTYNWGVAVQGLNTITASLSGQAGVYGSTITAYTLSGDNYMAQNQSLLIEQLANPGTITITGKVTDSRGRTATVTRQVTVYEYAPPYFESLEVGRCNSAGNLSSDGHYGRCKGTYVYSSVNNLNTISCTIIYIETKTGAVTSAGTLTNGVTKLIGNGDLASDLEYQVVFTLTDRVQSIQYTRYINSSAFIFHCRKGGRGIAFGMAAELDEAVQFHPDWKVIVGKGENQRDLANLIPAGIGAADRVHSHDLSTDEYKQMLVDLIYPIGSLYMSGNNVSPATFLGGTWEQIKDRFLLAAGDTYSAGSTGGAASVSHYHNAPVATQSSIFGVVNINGTNRGGNGKGYSTANRDYSGTLTQNVTLYKTSNTSVDTMPPYLTVYVWKRIADPNN